MFNAKPEKDTMAAAPIPERLRKSAKVLILTADKTQDLEFFYPYYRLNEAGYTVDVATPDGGKFEGKHGMGLQQTKALADVRAEEYALLYIPGGKAPEKLRKEAKAVALVQEFFRAGKPIAAICHGAQLLVTADIIRGRRISAWPEVRGEVEEAGATFVDEALVEDGPFITGRMPGDLHRHLFGVLDYLEGAKSAQYGPRQSAA